MTDYFELNISLQGFDLDALSGILQMHNCSGILELSDTEWVVYLSGEVTPEDVERLLEQLKQINPDFDSNKATLRGQESKDWNAEWRKHFVPLNPVANLWICPPWDKPEKDGAEILLIDPQMAFGTGHHETTALMLEIMNRMTLADQRILDLGCGSGILALFARMRQAGEIVGIDIDQDSIDNAWHNMTLNKLKDIDFRVGDIHSVGQTPYDVILANIQFFILKPIAAELRAALKPGSKLLLSGLLLEEESAVAEVYGKAGFELISTNRKKEWIAMLWRAA
ncbi:MAG: 50S ribosomal protein L11 methyltransferase [Calditrichia bacterium]